MTSEFFPGMRITVEGVDDVVSDLTRLADQFPATADKVANKFMLALEGRSKIESPVDTGRLRASIYSKLVGFTGQSFVSTNTDYAIFPHRNNPYMERALEMVSTSQFNTILNSEVDKLFRKIAK